MIEKKKNGNLQILITPYQRNILPSTRLNAETNLNLWSYIRIQEILNIEPFSNLPDYMKKNDLLITNNTKVFPARLYANKDRTEAKVEVFLLRS